VEDIHRFPVEAVGERLGELFAWSARKKLAARDIHTLAMLARELGLVAKTVCLMEETRRLAFTDQLTGLPNRHRTAEQLVDELKRAHRYGTPLSIVLCDIDHFKSVNDTYGHNIGDDVLRQVARTLAQAVRNVDTVARWGGEEFLVILPNTSPAGARIVAERVRQQVERAPAVPGGPERRTLSLGVATFCEDPTPEALLERADQALYRAKHRGRNRVEFADAPAP
jgi:two-component system cell cycle response regulator